MVTYVGINLLGARVLTDIDKAKMDRTVVRLCAGQVYSAKEADSLSSFHRGLVPLDRADRIRLIK